MITSEFHLEKMKEMIIDDQPKDLSSKTASAPGIPLTNLRTPTLEEIQEDENDFDGIRVPKMNSHGKLTTYKCKQCDFIATTKVDFWQHSKEKHYRPEKTFYCKFCPFVTELKHHFEYHVNGHTGTKPYKCEQCDYSCVNKSMLNSHMKSHSQIYQYRCKDCLYVSKYCHSLKNHLRKYNHRPSVVLNVDGTENHHQIIDVYGTRRGPRPKQKSVNSNKTSENFNSNLNSNAIENLQNEIPTPQIPFPLNPAFLNPFMMNEMFIRMALQLQQRALIAQNSNLIIPSAPNSIHSSENTSSDDDNDEAEDDSSDISDEEENRNRLFSLNKNLEKLQCKICEISFSNKEIFDIHMTNHNPENPLKCTRCDLICENGISFFKHLHEKH